MQTAESYTVSALTLQAHIRCSNSSIISIEHELIPLH